jgi:hypothetical protein
MAREIPLIFDGWLIAFAAMLIAGLVQSSIGFGLALIFQHSPADEIGANLAAHFSVGGAISIMMLAGIGKFGLPELTAAL